MSIYKNVINYIETKDGIEKVEENVNDILIRKDNKYKGWFCWSGIYTLAIYPDGNVYNATCKNKKIGNIFDDDKIELSKTKHVCTREWCTCAADLNIKKVKDKNFIDLVRPEKIIPKILEVELTNRCNLKCPMCYRNNLEFKEKIDLDISLFDKIDISKIELVDLCGSISEQTCHPKFFEFIDKFNHNTQISISSNGNTHDKNWWRELGNKLKKFKNSYVIFALDGLEDTHSIHRIGSNFEKVVENIKSFNETGATSVVQFIIFKHNQHQLMDVKNLSIALGCEKFLVRSSFLYDDKFQRPDIWDLKTRHEMCDIHEEKEIDCKHLNTESIFIDYTGNVFPCCFFFKCKHHSEKHSEEYNLYLKNCDKINLYKNNLNDIFGSEFFKTIHKKYKELSICESFCRFKSKDFLNTTE